MIKKIAVLTSGGDSPGMNSAVRSVVKSALSMGFEAYLVYEGYKGLHQGRIEKTDGSNIDVYNRQGGTFIYSSRYPEFKQEKIRKETKKRLDKLGIDALVVVGGDGSYMGAQLLHELGVKTIGLPGTIDNDISSTDFTIGYDTALNTIVENAERVRDTINSHHRGAIIEVMGHGCGDLALFSGLAVGAEVVATNESPLTIKEIAKVFHDQIHVKKKPSVLAIVSEKLFHDLKKLEEEVTKLSNVETRVLSLGHVQRGGVPTASERINASLMGLKAVELLSQDKSGLVVGILDGEIKATPILEALALQPTNRKNLAKQINKLNQA